MWILSDTVIFPILQISLLVFCIVAFSNSGATTAPMPNNISQPSSDNQVGDASVVERMNLTDKIDATVVRGKESMKALGATAGFSIVVIALINGSAFNNDKFWLRDFSVLINVLDTLAVLYLCFWCGSTRIKIVAMFGEATIDR
jgi:hypothetical protein